MLLKLSVAPNCLIRLQKMFEENDLLKNLGQEPDSRMGSLWSRVYFLKNVK